MFIFKYNHNIINEHEEKFKYYVEGLKTQVHALKVGLKMRIHNETNSVSPHPEEGARWHV